MSIRDMILRGQATGQAKVGPWEVATTVNGNRALYHYGTWMLTWSPHNPADPAILDWSIGHGSVSDQNGMNTAFKALDIPRRYQRDQRGGGPRVVELVFSLELGYYVHPAAA